MNIKAICESCEKQFQVDDKDIRQQKVKAMDSGEILYIMSYVCAYCGKVHYVQVDNDETKEQLNKCTRLMAKLTRLRSTKNGTAGSTNVLFRRARAKLNEMRLELMETYNESLVVDLDSEEAFNVRFSL